jgi:hypothetical protein
MKKIGSAADQLAFRLAIEQAEAALAGSEKPVEAAERPEGEEELKEPHEAPQRRAEDRERSSEGLRSFERARAAKRAAEATQLEALARKAGMDPDAAARLADGLRAQAPSDWTFVMLSPSQNSAVVRWLGRNSKRPVAALSLWARLFEVMRNDTGEILQSREELAQWLGVLPRDLSSIMTELASINAVRREKRGREVRYFMNSTVATHLPGPEARAKAREADGPLLTVVQGSQSQPGSS